jgi:hypothetical protein
VLAVIGQDSVIQRSRKWGNRLAGEPQASAEVALHFNEAGTISAVDEMFGFRAEIAVPAEKVHDIEADFSASHKTHPSGPAAPIVG